MHSRWNSQILPIAETAISCAFEFSETGRFGSFISMMSSDINPEKDRKPILVVKLLLITQ